MELHEKLNKLSEYLSEIFYVSNNSDFKSPEFVKYGGYTPSDFNLLTIDDLIFNMPRNVYLGCRFHPTGEDGSFILELLQHEYSLHTDEISLLNRATMSFGEILYRVKSLLTGDQITFDFEPFDEFVIRDNFSANDKQRIAVSKMFKCTLE
jgi:hypothetical protein